MDVGVWLRALGLGQYEEKFRDNKIDADVLPRLTADDLKDVGVAAVGDRRRLLDAIAALAAAKPADASPFAHKSVPLRSDQLVAERRPITVMFCDLVGSTSLAAKLDAEDWRNLINAYLYEASTAVIGLGGHVQKKLGDGLMALFGYPQAQENDAERAVRAALAIQRALADLNARNARSGAPELSARVGIESGPVIVDAVGEVFGEAPNVAARVQAAAEPGAVIVTATVQRQVAGLFVAEDKGDSPIYSISLETAVIGGDAGNETTVKLTKNNVKMIVPGFNDDLAVTHDGKSLLFTRMSVRFPNEIFRASLSQPLAAAAGPNVFAAQEVCTDSSGKIKPEGCKPATVEKEKSEVQLTDLNHAVLARVAMSPLESFWFTGAGNEKVEGFLVKPPNFDPKTKYPVKFIVHGGPEVPEGDEWTYRWNPELFAANGYVVIMINFHGSPGYGQKFVDAINGDWGGAPFEDLMKGLDEAERTYPFIDKDRECALGASYGGYMVNWILGHSNRFKCIVSHDGPFNNESAYGTTEELWFPELEFKGTLYNNRELYRKWSPHLSALNFKTPTLVVHGQLDYRVDVSEGFQLFTTLQRLKVPSKMLYFPDEGHWVLKPQNSQLWYKTVNDWVDQWVKK